MALTCSKVTFYWFNSLKVSKWIQRTFGKVNEEAWHNLLDGKIERWAYL